MCGITGIISTALQPLEHPNSKIEVMNELQQHRGPDGEGVWVHPKEFLGLGHRRLTIIDQATGDQPMSNPMGNTIVYNGELYNYIELRNELRGFYTFQTASDTEVILAAYQKWGEDCLDHLRGMFAFAIWDEKKKKLFCARDRFGIKPFYYLISNGVFYFASEAKALIPFVKNLEVSPEALQDYLVFQLCLNQKTLFKDIHELQPSHKLTIEKGVINTSQYWEVYYKLDFDHTRKYFEERLRYLIEDSVKMHLRSDVPVGAYVSGGIDSSSLAGFAARASSEPIKAFNGKFEHGAQYDESRYARALAKMHSMELYECSMTENDFTDSLSKIIYHLDFPVAGPGSFPQYHVSKLAAQYRKVVLGGQGGDEIFGGYVRYLIGYFEQCIKGAIDGTLNNGNYVVTYQSIIPNLVTLQNYKGLLKTFFASGLFEDIDRRYFRLINRAPDLQEEVLWGDFKGGYSPFDSFQKIFNGKNVGKESYFDKMTHFDFKTLLPGLLQVEDRMSMAHGLESRVPLLDHPLVEFAATMPADIKFKDGALKMSLVNTVRDMLPPEILNRKDKMGFPVPLGDWLKSGKVRNFVRDHFESSKAKTRPYMNGPAILKSLESEGQFGRKIWGLLSLEVWYQEYFDKHVKFKALLDRPARASIKEKKEATA